MSEAPKLRLRCPECRAEIVVDAATGEILFHKGSKERLPNKSFDDLLAGIDREKSEAEEVFAREVAAMKDRERLLDEKFREAMRRAEEEPDEAPPPRPFDLD